MRRRPTTRWMSRQRPWKTVIYAPRVMRGARCDRRTLVQMKCPNGAADSSGLSLRAGRLRPTWTDHARRHDRPRLTNPAYTPDYDRAARPPCPHPSLIRPCSRCAPPTATRWRRWRARGPLLLVFLRHFGCPLCQEMVADVAARRTAMADSGTTVVFVHMHPEPQAAAFFARYGVSDLQRVSDPAVRSTAPSACRARDRRAG